MKTAMAALVSFRLGIRVRAIGDARLGRDCAEFDFRYSARTITDGECADARWRALLANA